MSETRTLWGLSVVVSEEMPKGQIILGRLPTIRELEESGPSFGGWIESHAKEVGVITGLDDQ